MDETIDRFRRGDQEILARVYEQSGPHIYRFLLDRVRGAADARDLTQEVFATAFKERTRAGYSGNGTIEGFLIGIARNLVMHHFRAGRVRDAGTYEIARSAELRSEEAAPLDERLNASEAQRILRAFLEELSAEDRAFFEKHMMERPARRITAALFSITEDQVRYRELKLREKALAYLKRVGYLDSTPRQLEAFSRPSGTQTKPRAVRSAS